MGVGTRWGRGRRPYAQHPINPLTGKPYTDDEWAYANALAQNTPPQPYHSQAQNILERQHDAFTQRSVKREAQTYRGWGRTFGSVEAAQRSPLPPPSQMQRAGAAYRRDQTQDKAERPARWMRGERGTTLEEYQRRPKPSQNPVTRMVDEVARKMYIPATDLQKGAFQGVRPYDTRRQKAQEAVATLGQVPPEQLQALDYGIRKARTSPEKFLSFVQEQQQAQHEIAGSKKGLPPEQAVYYARQHEARTRLSRSFPELGEKDIASLDADAVPSERALRTVFDSTVPDEFKQEVYRRFQQGVTERQKNAPALGPIDIGFGLVGQGASDLVERAGGGRELQMAANLGSQVGLGAAMGRLPTARLGPLRVPVESALIGAGGDQPRRPHVPLPEDVLPSPQAARLDEAITASPPASPVEAAPPPLRTQAAEAPTTAALPEARPPLLRPEAPPQVPTQRSPRWVEPNAPPVAKRLPPLMKESLIKRARRFGFRVSNDGFVETECL